ncbi:MAG: Uncharacterised protein [Arcobacter lacus]|nr:MAG: Uncharacterised protein [Arcobacter lacus]
MNNHNKDLFLILIISALMALFLNGCTNSKREVPKSFDFPSWYLNPMINDDVYLYGIGEGVNLDEAKQNALVSLSSSLMITIESKSSLKKESILKYREYVFKNFNIDTTSNTEKLTFKNYETINVKKHRYNNILVQVRVKKIDLINTLNKEVKSLYKEYKDISNSDEYDLKRYFKLLNLQRNFISKTNKVEILADLDKSFYKTYHEKLLKNIYSSLSKLKSSITFSINSHNVNDNMSSKISEYLTQNDFLIKDDSKYKVVYEIINNSKIAQGMHIINSTVIVEILYMNEKVVSKEYKLDGYSSSSKNDAIYDAYTKLKLDFLTYFSYHSVVK